MPSIYPRQRNLGILETADRSFDRPELPLPVQLGEDWASPRTKAPIIANWHSRAERNTQAQRGGHEMRRIRVLVLVCALVLSTTASADTVEIEFDFGNSVMSFLGLITIPPDGTINDMGATTILPAIQTGNGATSVQTGSALLKSLMVDMTLDAFVGLFGTRITGPVIVSQVGTSTGPFTNTQTIMFGGTGNGTGTGNGSIGMSLFVSAHLECVGLFCGVIGNFPVSIVGTNPPPPGQAFTISLAGLNTPGAGSVGGTMPISIPPETENGSPFTGTVFLDGNEVSRTYVPEPGALVQLIAGAIALAGLSLRSKRHGEVSQ
jgi:hypothetical protein